MKNLAPNLCRQRVVIELLHKEYISKETLEDYLLQLTTTAGMKPVDGPYIYSCGNLGFGGWIHWTTSGAHIYTYPPEKNGTDSYLITVDAYTCKSFDLVTVANFTKKFFSITDDEKITYKEV